MSDFLLSKKESKKESKRESKRERRSFSLPFSKDTLAEKFL